MAAVKLHLSKAVRGILTPRIQVKNTVITENERNCEQKRRKKNTYTRFACMYIKHVQEDSQEIDNNQSLRGELGAWGIG